MGSDEARPPSELRSAALLSCHRRAERLEALQLRAVAHAQVLHLRKVLGALVGGGW